MATSFGNSCFARLVVEYQRHAVNRTDKYGHRDESLNNKFAFCYNLLWEFGIDFI